MRYFILSAKLLLYAYLAYLLYFLAADYDPAGSRFHPPFVLFVVDWINVFIHEAGHFFFKIFGRWLYILGGSVMQVLLPAILVAVTWRQSIRAIGLPLFWTGESMVNVSVYIKDAPYRKLHLLAQGLIHDWNWLLNGDPDSAEILGTIVFALGLILCASAIGAGIWFAFRQFREDGYDPAEALGLAGYRRIGSERPAEEEYPQP